MTYLPHYQKNCNTGLSNKDQKCYNCGEPGHISRNCPKKKGNAANNDKDDSEDELRMVCQFIKSSAIKCDWIADSGALSHMTKLIKELTDIKQIDQPVQVGNGQKMKCTQKCR